MQIITQIVQLLALLSLGLHLLIALFMLIPGDEPERTLSYLLELIERYSRKK